MSDKTACSNARATILCILAEFCSKNVKAYTRAPDVLLNHSHKSLIWSNFRYPIFGKANIATQDNFILPFWAVFLKNVSMLLKNEVSLTERISHLVTFSTWPSMISIMIFEIELDVLHDYCCQSSAEC